MGEKFNKAIRELKSHLVGKHGSLDENTRNLLREIRTEFSGARYKFKKERTQRMVLEQEINVLRQNYNGLSAEHQGLEGNYKNLGKKCEELSTRCEDLEERCEGLEKALADASVEKTEWKELYGQGSEINEELRGKIKELEKERRGLMYDLHVVKAQIALGLPQELGIGKIVVIGDYKLKLIDLLCPMEDDIVVVEQGVIDDMDVSLSMYLGDIFKAPIVTIDRKTHWDDKQRVIQSRLENAEFVVEVGPVVSHNIQKIACPQGITCDNGHYVLMRRRNPEAVVETINNIIKIKRQEVYVPG